MHFLLERDKSRRVCGTNTRPSMFNWLVCDGKLTQVVTNHFRLEKKVKIILPNTYLSVSPINTTEYVRVDNSCLIEARFEKEGKEYPSGSFT